MWVKLLVKLPLFSCITICCRSKIRWKPMAGKLNHTMESSSLIHVHHSICILDIFRMLNALSHLSSLKLPLLVINSNQGSRWIVRWKGIPVLLVLLDYLDALVIDVMEEIWRYVHLSCLEIDFSILNPKAKWFGLSSQYLVRAIVCTRAILLQHDGLPQSWLTAHG